MHEKPMNTFGVIPCPRTRKLHLTFGLLGDNVLLEKREYLTAFLGNEIPFFHDTLVLQYMFNGNTWIEGEVLRMKSINFNFQIVSSI